MVDQAHVQITEDSNYIVPSAQFALRHSVPGRRLPSARSVIKLHRYRLHQSPENQVSFSVLSNYILIDRSI
jgi:hypothetical protein